MRKIGFQTIFWNQISSRTEVSLYMYSYMCVCVCIYIYIYIYVLYIIAGRDFNIFRCNFDFVALELDLVRLRLCDYFWPLQCDLRVCDFATTTFFSPGATPLNYKVNLSAITETCFYKTEKHIFIYLFIFLVKTQPKLIYTGHPPPPPCPPGPSFPLGDPCSLWGTQAPQVWTHPGRTSWPWGRPRPCWIASLQLQSWGRRYCTCHKLMHVYVSVFPVLYNTPVK